MESSAGESSEAILYRNSGITSSISDYYKSEIDSRFNSSAVVSSSSDDSTAKSSTSNNLNSDAVSISGYDNSTAKSSITNSENCTSNYDSNAKISTPDVSSTTTSESSSEHFVVKSSISDYQSTVIYDNHIGKTNTQVYNCSSKPCIRQNFESRSTSNVKFAENNRTNKRFNTPCCISDPPVYDRRDSFGEYLLMRKHKCKRCSCEDNKKYATFKTRLKEREYFLDALNKTRRNQVLKQMAKVKHPSEMPDEPPADPNAPKVGDHLTEGVSESGSSGNATLSSGEQTPASETHSATSTHPSATSSHPSGTSSHPSGTSSHPSATSSHPSATSTHPSTHPSANHPVTSAGPAHTTGSKKKHAIENKMSVESVLIERQSLIDISKNRTKRFAKNISHSKKSVEFDKSVEIELEKDTRSKLFKKFKRPKEKLTKMDIKSDEEGKKKSKMKGKEDLLVEESDAKVLDSFQSHSIIFEDVDKKSKKPKKKKKKKGKKDDDDDDDEDKDEDEEKDKDEDDDDEDDEGKSKKKKKKKKKKKSKDKDEDEDEDEGKGKKKKKKKKKDKDDDDDDGGDDDEEDEDSDGSKKGKKKGKKSKKSKKSKKKKDDKKEESDSSSSVDSDDESEEAQDKRDRKEVKRLEKLLESEQFKLAFTADPNAGWFMSCMDYDQTKETDIQLLRRKGRCYCDFERNPDCICTGIPPGHEDVTPYDCKEGCCCDINPNPKCNCG